MFGWLCDYLPQIWNQLEIREKNQYMMQLFARLKWREKLSYLRSFFHEWNRGKIYMQINFSFWVYSTAIPKKTLILALWGKKCSFPKLHFFRIWVCTMVTLVLGVKNNNCRREAHIYEFMQALLTSIFFVKWIARAHMRVILKFKGASN